MTASRLKTLLVTTAWMFAAISILVMRFHWASFNVACLLFLAGWFLASGCLASLLRSRNDGEQAELVASGIYSALGAIALVLGLFVFPRPPEARDTIEQRSRPLITLSHVDAAARKIPAWKHTRFDIRKLHIEGTGRSRLLGIPMDVSLNVTGEGRRSQVEIVARARGAFLDFGETDRLVKRYRRSFAESWICTGAVAKAARR